MRGGGFDLAAVLAQFWRDPRRAERGEDLILGRAGARPPTAAALGPISTNDPIAVGSTVATSMTREVR